MVPQTDSTKTIQPPTIDSDLPCRQCGYNLRGLLASGVCPECGHAVAESARRNLLRDSDPAYAANLRVAAMVMIVGLSLSAFASALIPPTVVINYLDDPSWRFFAFIVIVAAIFVMSAGLWKLTSIDPAVLEDRRQERLRRLVRVMVATSSVTQLFGLAVLSSSRDGSALSSSTFDLLPLWMLILANAAALITCVFATFEHLRMLSWRIPDQVLARRFETLRWIFGIPFTLLTLATAGELSLALSPWDGILNDHVVTLNTVVWAITAFAGLFYMAALLRLRRGAVVRPQPLQGPS